jgi:hypothetical protein
MDQLYKFMASLDQSGVESLAAACNTTPLNLWKLARKLRRGGAKVNPRLASLLERETNGKVQRWDLIPDAWWWIWPELPGVPGAPPVPESPRLAANDDACQRAA